MQQLLFLLPLKLAYWEHRYLNPQGTQHLLGDIGIYAPKAVVDHQNHRWAPETINMTK